MSRWLFVPVHPGRRHLLEVGEGGQLAATERGAVSDALGLIQADRGLGQRVVQSVPNGADGRRQPFQEQHLSEVDRRVLAASIGVKPNSV